jgi:hypothetical protein
MTQKKSYLDVKESLIQEMKVDDIVKVVNIGGFALTTHDKMGVSDQYLVLDTYRKNKQSNPMKGIFAFDLSYRSVPNIRVTLTRDSLSDCIEIQAFPFYIRKPRIIDFVTSTEKTSFLPKLVASSTPTSNNFLNYRDTFMLEIKELTPNAVSDPGAAWHTFMYTPTLSPFDDLLFLTPINDTFVFTDVSEHFNKLTLQFRSENDTISFNEDTYCNISPQYTTVGLDNYLTFNIVGHELETDDRIHIIEFNTGDNIIDNYIQKKSGHLINVVSNNSFRLNPDVDITHLLSGGVFINTPRYCIIYVDKRRMRIPFRFRKLVKKITNYKSP